MKPFVWLRLFAGLAVFAAVLRAEDGPAPAAIAFSSAGYAAGARGLPAAPAVLLVKPSGGDDTALLQAALDAAAALPGEGLRAVVLEPGEFYVAGQLVLGASRVVLRGSADADGKPTSLLRANETDRRALIRIGAREAASPAGKAIAVADVTVPAGAKELPLASVAGLAVGDRVSVRRPSTKEWIDSLEVNAKEGNFPQMRVHWLPGSRDLTWFRTVVAIDPAASRLTLDAPITTALEPRFGGGSVTRLAAAPVHDVGVEQVVLESHYDTGRPRDEDHAWIGVQLGAVEDVWVRGVVFRHFVGSAVRVGPAARRITVAGCRSEEPVSELGGFRRQTFLVEGQQVLVRDCTSDAGLNDFALGLGAAGPNVFLRCRATNALGWSGSGESWASGALYDRVKIEGAALRLARDDAVTQGAGWTAANCVLRDCTATEIVAAGPPGAPVVVESAGPVAAGNSVVPADAELPREFPSVRAFAFTAPPEALHRRAPPLRIVNGRFVLNGRVVWGGQFNAAWWKGQATPANAVEASGRSITRFMPGRDGRGATEDLGQFADDLRAAGTPFYAAIPGLWYERRRDDHQLMARPDGRVWAPFYEQPWQRSGEGTAWDGLSRYDLKRFNPWYFARLDGFARECEPRGLILYANVYNTHNVLETAAHWTDFPWRPANNVNDTGLPEPAPLDEKNAVHLADQFFDVSYPPRRRLHQAYIAQHLRTFANSSNVILCVGFQFAGPRAFQEFFLDEVARYADMASRRYLVALATSKDVTDAILADPKRAEQVAVIDTRYWQTQPDGTLWAPRGDVNRAFREQNVQLLGKPADTPPDTTPLNVYRGVRAYRDKFPDKAIVAWHGGAGPIPVLMAGGAQALLRNPAGGQSQGGASDATPFDRYVQEKLADLLMVMVPQDGWLADAERNWCLADGTGHFVLCYSLAGESIALTRELPGKRYTGEWFNPRTGEATPLAAPVATQAGATFPKPTAEDWVLFLRGP